MFGLDKFLDYRVSRLISEYRNSRDSSALPIDIFEIARIAGISSIEKREMIPEAVLEHGPDGFKVFLQNNFSDFPGHRLRQRFSLAHEIGHTLFYESGDGPPKFSKDAPTGDKLEVACHRAAALLLLPANFLKAEISRFTDFPHVEHLVELAARFDVSIEVLVRRLRNLGFFEQPERAPVLVRGCEELIEYAVYPPWLKMFPLPKEALLSRAGLVRIVQERSIGKARQNLNKQKRVAFRPDEFPQVPR